MSTEQGSTGGVEHPPSTATSAAQPFAHRPIPRRLRVRTASALDRVRVNELLRRMEAGEGELDAFWAVVTSEDLGYCGFIGRTDRPRAVSLRRKLAALLERTQPGLVAEARNLALARLARLSDEALLAVSEVVGGSEPDARMARARLDAAKTILASLGIADRGGGVTVATQVNVSSHAPDRVPDGA
ncbi:MAG: hypothetical protein HMLKMBBP_02118 [Planctomycetes bacterium]|nr:hypothetical protein [Planctomycetota bacterium]